jgi:hypothetical protein
MDFIRVLDTVVAHLEGRQQQWAVVGGLALQSYGLSRATQDLDVLTEAAAREELVRFMESLGYETLHASSAFSNHLHSQGALGRVDFVYVDRKTADRLFAACRTVPWIEGRMVKVPAPEHLIAMKVHAVKNDPQRLYKEMADIQHLLGLPDVDRAAVRDFFQAAGLLSHYDDLTRNR